MRIKSVTKYYFSDLKKSILVFYLILIAITIVMGSMLAVVISSSDNASVNISGGETATMFFLFIVGLNSFKQSFLFLSANGITRKTQFLGFLAAAFTACIIMAFVDTAYSNILPEFFTYRSAFRELYEAWADNASSPALILTNFLWIITLYLFSIIFGYLVTSLYYRMNKATKIAVSVGVPVLFTTVFPIIDSMLTNGAIFRWLGNMFSLLMGFGNGANPLIAAASFVGFAIIMGGVSYMLGRRAIVKT